MYRRWEKAEVQKARLSSIGFDSFECEGAGKIKDGSVPSGFFSSSGLQIRDKKVLGF